MHTFSRVGIRTMTIAVAFVATVGITSVGASASTESVNLVHNSGADGGPGSSDGSVVKVPGWTMSTGTTFTAVKYGATGGEFPKSTSPGPTNRGKNFFAGGPGESVVATQSISLTKYKSAINGGHATFALSAYLGGATNQTDEAFVELDWKNASGFLVGSSATLGPVTPADRKNVTGLLKRATSGKIPKGASSAFVQLSLSGGDGSYDNAYADDVSLVVTTP